MGTNLKLRSISAPPLSCFIYLKTYSIRKFLEIVFKKPNITIKQMLRDSDRENLKVN